MPVLDDIAAQQGNLRWERQGAASMQHSVALLLLSFIFVDNAAQQKNLRWEREGAQFPHSAIREAASAIPTPANDALLHLLLKSWLEDHPQSRCGLT